MSHIGKKPITIPGGVTLTPDGELLRVKGPKGELVFRRHPTIAVSIDQQLVTCTIEKQTKQAKALWGTTRAHLNNLIEGVMNGFTRQLEMHGVGYRAALKGHDLELSVGFSHPVVFKAPAGITFTVQKEIITVEGIDKQLVGHVASQLRAIRPPEPYQGKGIRYVGEVIRRKVGKVVGTTT